MNLFAAKKGSRLSDVDANVLGIELHQLTQQLKAKDPQRIGVKAEEVVEAASDPSSPLHRFFEWDDDVAGKRWRVHHARVLMGAIVPIIHSNQKVEVRAFNAVRIVTADEAAQAYAGQRKQREYVEIHDLSTNDEFRKQVTDAFFRDFNSLLQRYEKYRVVWAKFATETDPVFTALNPSPKRRPRSAKKAA